MEKINKLSIPATILIVSIILGGFYYVSQLSNQKFTTKESRIDNFELASLCSQQAEAFLDYFETDTKTRDNTYITNHYNSKLNKCFVKIIMPTSVSYDRKTYTEYLYDALEKKEYGWFMVGIPTYGEPIACNVLDTLCKSRDEYDNLIYSYINE